MYSSSQLNQVLSSYKLSPPCLPHTLQIQTLVVLLDSGPPLHQSWGRGLQMWLTPSIEITPITVYNPINEQG